MKTLDIKPSVLMMEFVDQYAAMFDIDKEKALRYIKTNEHFDFLTDRWYEALELGDLNKAYSVYDDEYYFTDMWNCFKVYSRNYLRNMKAPKLLNGQSIFDYMGDVKLIVDTGCGTGLTTGALKEMFNGSTVYGTNLRNTKQWQFCETKATQFEFSMIEDISQVVEKEVDLVFSSEYFEHIEAPAEHVDYIVKQKNPKYFIIANAFNTRAIGHFITYKHYGQDIDQTKISKIFNDKLKSLGYVKIKTNLFNNRPNFWARKDMVK